MQERCEAVCKIRHLTPLCTSIGFLCELSAVMYPPAEYPSSLYQMRRGRPVLPSGYV